MTTPILPTLPTPLQEIIFQQIFQEDFAKVARLNKANRGVAFKAFEAKCNAIAEGILEPIIKMNNNDKKLPQPNICSQPTRMEERIKKYYTEETLQKIFDQSKLKNIIPKLRIFHKLFFAIKLQHLFAPSTPKEIEEPECEIERMMDFCRKLLKEIAFVNEKKVGNKGPNSVIEKIVIKKGEYLGRLWGIASGSGFSGWEMH